MSIKTEIIAWPRGRLDLTSGTQVMGVLNVTPDSFSDGGHFYQVDHAIAHGLEMAEQGAAVIDVGAESTRPGAAPVPAQEQIRRAVPVIEALAGRVQIPLSVDTTDVTVARAALDAGAAMLNDITAGTDAAMLRLAAEHQVPLVLMHMQGTPATMQQQPVYQDVVAEVKAFLTERAQRALTEGVPAERILIDPGIGFGKTLEHNLALLRCLDVLVATGYPVLVGTSRKRMLEQLTGRTNPIDRIYATAATVAWCAHSGAALVRVHDVAAMMDVVKVVNAINH